MKRFIAILSAFFILFILTSCSKPVSKVIIENPPPLEVEKEPEKPVIEQPEVDYNAVKANEAGKIMILMYHGIGDKEEEWVRTQDNFKKDLKALYDKGYRTISLHDYINNNIKVPAGCTPFVLTFDDGLQNQYNIVDKDGKSETDLNCAVSILENFSKEHIGFGSAATFYVYFPIPFRQKEKIKEKFEYLVQNGFDIGNHSYTHEMLGKMDALGIQKQLALNISAAQNYLPGYVIDTLALPYGSRPKDEALRKYIVSGEFEGTVYNNKAVLLVGSNPAPAPNNKDFDPSAIPRIRGSEMKTEGTGIYDWLKYFDSHFGERYISDGNPDTIAVPKTNESKINLNSISGKKLIVY